MLSQQKSKEDLNYRRQQAYGSLLNHEPSHSSLRSTASTSRRARTMSGSSTSTSAAGGIAGIEAVTSSWNKSALYTAWGAILILSVAITLAMQTIFVYNNYATASFTKYSLLSALQVVQGVLYVVTRPLIAKVADVIGRFEGFLISTVSMTIGTVMLAAAPNMDTYFVAQIWYIVGQVGLQFMQVIFAADTSDLVNRALFNILPNICFAFVPWTAAPITTYFLEHYSWRWGVAIWAIVLPCCAIPLLSILFSYKINSQCRPKHKLNWKKLRDQLDIGGSALLACGLTFVFIAIPLASSSDNSEWKQPHIILMLLVGTLCLFAFPLYEKRYPQYPILSLRLLKNREVEKSFLFITLYVVAYSIYSPYFFAWLMVVFDLSNSAATNVNAVTTVASTIAGTSIAFLIRFTRKVKWYVVIGIIVHTVGLLMIFHYRKVGSTTAQLVIAEAIDGIGAGILTTPNQVFVQAFCSHQEVAQTTGLYLSFFSLGQVIGDAVSGAIYRRHYGKLLAKYLPDQSPEWINSVFDDYTQALKYPLGSPERTGVINAFNSVMRKLLIPPLIIYGFMFLISLSFEDIKLDEIDSDVPGVVFGGTTSPTAPSNDESGISDNESVPRYYRLDDEESIPSRRRRYSSASGSEFGIEDSVDLGDEYELDGDTRD